MRRENRERENSCKLSVTSLVGGWAINRMEHQCKSCFVNVDVVVLFASKLDLHVNVMVDPPLSPDPLPLPLPPLHRTLNRATEEHAASLSPTICGHIRGATDIPHCPSDCAASSCDNEGFPRYRQP